MMLPLFHSKFPLKFSLAHPLPHSLKPSLGRTVAARYSTKLFPGQTFIGESGEKYELVRPLGTQRPNYQANTWIAVKDSEKEVEYVAKGPLLSKYGKDTTASAFMHEVKMQKLFKNDQMIRPMIDFIPSSESGGPLMILKPFEQTLWDARNTRPFSVPEIMKGVLLGLYTVHMKDLVYTGENNILTQTTISVTLFSPLKMICQMYKHVCIKLRRSKLKHVSDIYGLPNNVYSKYSTTGGVTLFKMANFSAVVSQLLGTYLPAYSNDSHLKGRPNCTFDRRYIKDGRGQNQK